MNRPFDSNALTELKQLYDAAEKTIKAGEFVQSNVCIPAINELRYAGQHLLRYLSGPSPDDVFNDDDGNDRDDLVSAMKHCKRAQYDAAEGPVLFFLRQIKDFQEDYKNIAIVQFFSDYPKLITRIDDISKKLQEFQRINGKRQNHADELVKYFDEIQEIAKTLKAMRDQLNLIIEQRAEEKKAVNRNLIATIIIGVVGIIVAIIN